MDGMENELRKKYGLFTAISMVVGIVIGSGVFFKAEKVLKETNGNIPLGIGCFIDPESSKITTTVLSAGSP